MQKKYDPKEMESRWQEAWEERGTFRARDDAPGEKYYVLEMFAYPSGRLHMGHVRNYSIGDVMARYRKKRGFNVLHPMGWDAFGLPAENAAIERGLHPAGWTYDNIATMRGQLKSLGIAYDWDREIATCRPEYYKWEQLVFTRAFERGLVYRKKALVNWSEKMQTVLANEQVIDGRDYRYGLPVVQKELTQWFFKTTAYAEELLAGLDELAGSWPERVLLEQRARIGKSHGARVDFRLETPVDGEAILPVFTTRPDTLWGVTFMSLAAEHPLALKLAKGTPREGEVSAFVQKVLAEDKHKRGSEDCAKEGVFTGAYCVNPVNGERVPIHVANFVLMDYGTGAVMAVPAHDQRDFEFARKYGLPVKVVIRPPDGRAADPGAMTAAYVDDGVQVASAQFDGLPNREAIERITDFLAEKGQGGRTVSYRLRDWCVSRQRYWGAPIPMVHCDSCDVVPVPEDQLPVRLPENVVFQAEGGSPLSRCEEFVRTTCPKCGGPARRETDTFDTFVESSWYFLRYLSPHLDTAPLDPGAVAFWMPVDQYIGGIEHAVGHLVYGRYYHRLMQDLGLFPAAVAREPFKRLLCQGMVCKETLFTLDDKGQPIWHTPAEVEGGVSKRDGKPIQVGRVEKMSKTKYNGVDPETIIATYGADSARLFTLFAAPPENDLVWKDEGVEGVHRFLTRLWNMIGQRLEAIRSAAPYDGDGTGLDEPTAELRRQTHKTIKAVTEDVDQRYRFNTAIARCMELVNALSKFEAPAAGGPAASVQRDAFAALVGMLSPFAPHVAEELWLEMGGVGLASEAPWPSFDPAVAADDTITIAVQVSGKLRATLEVERGIASDALEKLALDHENVRKHTAGKTIRKVIVVPGKLVNVVAG
ncbi:MAG: leucine--tRNA ligase [Proteobacteria bacterium]|jgi:leucyl-tRNA synthetase|nr:leucine--tRNA ligase [Pseudomonadota bacterium]